MSDTVDDVQSPPAPPVAASTVTGDIAVAFVDGPGWRSWERVARAVAVVVLSGSVLAITVALIGGAL